MRLSILIVNWNTAGMLARCLESLRLHPPTHSYEVIVVDNGSIDESTSMVRERFPEVKLIANDKNFGYAVANNQAIEASKGEFLLLLNSDIVITANSIDTMIYELIKTTEAGAVACKLCYPDGRPQPSCRSFPDLWALTCEISGLSRLFPHSTRFARYRMSYWNHNSTRFVDQPMMSCLLVRRKVWSEVGGLDSTFPIYFNDVDWSLRVHKAGWRILFTSNAEVIHEHGGSTRNLQWRRVWVWHQGLYNYHLKHTAGTFRGLKLTALFAIMAISLPLMLLRDAGSMLKRGY